MGAGMELHLLKKVSVEKLNQVVDFCKWLNEVRRCDKTLAQRGRSTIGLPRRTAIPSIAQILLVILPLNALLTRTTVPSMPTSHPLLPSLLSLVNNVPSCLTPNVNS